MPSRSPRKIPKITRSRSSRPQYNAFYWYVLAASALVLSGRHLHGTFWPPVRWYLLAASRLVLCARRFTTPKIMKNRIRKRRIYAANRHAWRRTVEEQFWLDIALIGREFGSPDYERVQLDAKTYEVEAKMERQRRENAVNFARASVGLEGFKLQEADEEIYRRFVAGEISISDVTKAVHDSVRKR